MSTRATYEFNNEMGSQTFYIHYDGYAEGAASYFINMLTYSGEGRARTFSEMFYRGNDLAEFTVDKNYHGDTKFHYEINEKEQKISMYTHSWDGPFKLIQVLSFDEFINKYSDVNIKKFKYKYHIESYFTESSALSLYEKEAKKHKEFYEKYPEQKEKENVNYKTEDLDALLKFYQSFKEPPQNVVEKLQDFEKPEIKIVQEIYNPSFLKWCKSYDQEKRELIELIEGEPCDVALLKSELKTLTGKTYEELTQ